MFKYLSKILQSFDPKARIAVLLIFVFAAISTIYIKSSFVRSDCSSLQIQIDNLNKSQYSIIQENNTIIQKNKELLDGYLKMDSLMKNMKVDTIFIEKTIEIHNDSNRSYVNKFFKRKYKNGSGVKLMKAIICKNKKPM
jgi:hypothetical protein